MKKQSEVLQNVVGTIKEQVHQNMLVRISCPGNALKTLLKFQMLSKIFLHNSYWTTTNNSLTLKFSLEWMEAAYYQMQFLEKMYL